MSNLLKTVDVQCVRCGYHETVPAYTIDQKDTDYRDPRYFVCSHCDPDGHLKSQNKAKRSLARVRKKLMGDMA